jgi:hypothetical protein
MRVPPLHLLGNTGEVHVHYPKSIEKRGGLLYNACTNVSVCHEEDFMEPNQTSIIPPQEAKNGIAPIGSSIQGSHNWQSRFWDNERHVSLQFATTEELDAAIDWLWTVPEVRELPRVHVGQNTMVVPAEAVEIFRKKGFQFVAGGVTSSSDLPPEEANRIRKTG